MRIKPMTREEMRERWERGQPPATGPAPASPPRPVNLKAIAELQGTVYFLFRGRPFCVPPLPWPMAVDIMDAYLRASEAPREMTAASVASYREAIADLARLLGQVVKPVGPLTRLWSKIRPKYNPIMKWGEVDVLGLALFLSGRRTQWSGFVTVPANPPRT